MNCSTIATANQSDRPVKAVRTLGEKLSWDCNCFTKSWEEPYFSNGVTISLPVATQDTAELLFYAMHGAEAIYRPDHAFSKAGVLLLELQPETLVQGHLFEQRDRERSKLLMQTLDNINCQFGARTVQYAWQV